MKGSLNLGKPFGIKVQVHWTFFLLIAWAIYLGSVNGGDLSSILWTIALILSVFLCVVLHEFGHALTARRFGISTRSITLLPIGGVANLERMPDEPRQELLVAVMGPAVNVVIAGLLYFFVQPLFPIVRDPEQAAGFLANVNAGNFLFYLFSSNIALVVFNAIPAFPMDGGRVLRALLALRMERVNATRIAAGLGRFIAVLFFFLGLIYNPMLFFIGLFVYFGASGEYLLTLQESILKGHKVSEAMMTHFTLFYPGDSLSRVGQILLSGSERHFIVGWDSDHVLGVLPQQKIMEAFRNRRNDLPVAELMEKDFKTAGPDDDLGEIYRKVQAQPYSFIPVMKNGKLMGAIDLENINEFMMIQTAQQAY